MSQPSKHAARQGTRRGRLRRLIVVLLALGACMLLNTPAAGAAPKDVSDVPAHLKKYVPGSSAWDASPWMTSTACQGRGGDFSAWAASVIADSTELLKVFNAQLFGPDAPDKTRNDAILAGYQQLATELNGTVPTGYCVDDMKRWAGEDQETRPFGFPWGTQNTSLYVCTDTAPGVKESEYRNKWVGAERVPCDGFHVSCKHAGTDTNRCEAWNEFSKDYTDRINKLRVSAINDAPAGHEGETDTKIKSPIDLADDMAESWFGQIAMAIAKGAATLLGEAMTFWTTSDRSSMLRSPAIKTIQDLLWYVGVVLLIASVMWQGIVMLYKRQPGPLVNTGAGLLSFIGWSTLGGTAAVLMYEAGLALTSQVLDEAIDKFSDSMAAAMQANLVISVAVVFFLAIIMFFLACIQWFMGFFRMGALVILLALIPLAAAGQVNDATKPWIPKVAGWALVLIWYQPVSGVIYAIGFVLIGDGTDIATILTGAATLGMAVIAMPAMHRFFDFGARSFASGGSSGGGAMAAGAAASAIGGGSGMAFSRYMDQSGPGSHSTAPSGEPSSGAPPLVSAHVGDGPVGGGTTAAGSGMSPGGPSHRPGGVASAADGTETSASDAADRATPHSATAGTPTGAAVGAAQVARDQVAGAMTHGAPPQGDDRHA